MLACQKTVAGEHYPNFVIGVNLHWLTLTSHTLLCKLANVQAFAVAGIKDSCCQRQLAQAHTILTNLDEPICHWLSDASLPTSRHLLWLVADTARPDSHHNEQQ